MQLGKNSNNQVIVYKKPREIVACRFCKRSYGEVEGMWYCKDKSLFSCDKCDKVMALAHASLQGECHHPLVATVTEVKENGKTGCND